MADTCEAVLWLGPCGDPATHHGTALCVHEHVRGGALCVVHAQQANDGYSPECGACLPDHRCLLGGWVVTPSRNEKQSEPPVSAGRSPKMTEEAP